MKTLQKDGIAGGGVGGNAEDFLGLDSTVAI